MNTKSKPTEKEIEERKQKRIDAYLASLNPNADISRQVINNKIKNINFLTKDYVFTNIMTFINALSDRTLAYIPVKQRDTEIDDDSNGKKTKIHFSEPSEENNYADLAVQIPKYKEFYFKAVRVKSFSLINIDGSHITWNENAINDNTFLVFYSTNPNELGKMIILSTLAYTDLMKFNNRTSVSCLDINKVHALREVLLINKERFDVIDYTQKPDIALSELISKNLKLFACNASKEMINENPLLFMNKRTHFGKHYIAYNLYNGQKVVLRDCNARNNFCSYVGIKLPDNHDVLRNCKVQNKIVKGEEVESCQTNIYSDSGWIITSYIQNDKEFKNYISVLINELISRSTMWKNKLLPYLDKIMYTLNKVFDKILEIKENLKDKLHYFRPLHLLDYICCTENIKIYDYFLEHKFMNQFYIKC